MTKKEVIESIDRVITLDAIHNTFDIEHPEDSNIIKHKAGLIIEIDDATFLVSNGGVNKFVYDYLEIQGSTELKTEELDMLILGYLQQSLARFITGEDTGTLPGITSVLR